MAHENERKNMDQCSNDLAAVQNHQPGRLDFQIVEKDVSVTEFRRKPSAVWRFLETTGHVVFFTRRGKRECAIMSIETHACLSGDYEKTMNEVEEVAAAWRAEQKARRKERRKESRHAGSRELPPEKHAAPEEDNSISFNPQTDPLPGSGNT